MKWTYLRLKIREIIDLSCKIILSVLLLFGVMTGQAQGISNEPLLKFKDFPEDAIYQDVQKSPSQRAMDVVRHLTFEETLKMIGGYNKFFVPGISRLGLRPVFMANASQGVNLRKPFTDEKISTAFPCALALASTWNTKLAVEMGKAIGEECRMCGVDILLGPGINMQRFSVSGRNYEYYGEDPILTSRMAVNFVRGLQGEKVIATAKHFIGNDQEFCRHITSSNMDERTLREIYLRPWKAVIQDAGVKAIMTGNNLVNGVPCSMDKPLLNDVLREEYGFTGMAMTDWQNTNYYPGLQYLFPSSGMSLLMPDNGTFVNYLDGYLKKYPSKKEAIRQALNKKVFENLLPLFEMGVYDREIKDTTLRKNLPNHQKLARQIAEEAICLLKNKDNLLPIPKNKTILLMGKPELYTGKGSGFVKGYDQVSFAEGLKTVYGNHFEESENPGEEQIKKADVIIYRLNKEAGEGQDVPFQTGFDTSIAKVARLNPNVVVVISSCNGLPMPWLQDVKAVVWGYFLGQERGNALANVLSGKVNPSGKLPFTLEKDFRDSPAPEFNYLGDKPYWFGNNDFYKTYWLGDDPEGANEQFREYVKPHQIIPVPYKEGIFMGYRWYDKQKKEVLFPFGLGLSYTQFRYSNLLLSKNTINADDTLIVSLDVQNTGDMDGAETVQLYLSDKDCSVERPVKELKYFQKVFLKTGEHARVEFTIKPEDLAYWDEKEQGWRIEPGTFEVLIASSSRDIRLHQSFNFKQSGK